MTPRSHRARFPPRQQERLSAARQQGGTAKGRDPNPTSLSTTPLKGRAEGTHLSTGGLSELILLSAGGTHSPDYRTVPHAAPRPKAPRSTQLPPTPEVRAGPPSCSTITTSSGAQAAASTHTAGRPPQPQAAPQPAPSIGPGRGRSHTLPKAAGRNNAASQTCLQEGGLLWGQRAPQLTTNAPSTGLSRWHFTSSTGGLTGTDPSPGYRVASAPQLPHGSATS